MLCYIAINVVFVEKEYFEVGVMTWKRESVHTLLKILKYNVDMKNDLMQVHTIYFIR